METSDSDRIKGLLRVYFLIVKQLDLPNTKEKEMLAHLEERILNELDASVKTSGLSYEAQERKDGQ